jgi:1-acyl-sn-glycerol-3-phosphate acyltransferase
MHFTIFKTPVINVLVRWISALILRMIGWRVDARVADVQKCVLIGAPHTSNWDFPIALMICFVLRLDVYWMGKASLFPPVFGTIMRWLGGIPVDRSKIEEDMILIQEFYAGFTGKNPQQFDVETINVKK